MIVHLLSYFTFCKIAKDPWLQGKCSLIKIIIPLFMKCIYVLTLEEERRPLFKRTSIKVSFIMQLGTGVLLQGQCHEQILLLLFIVKELKKHPVQVLYLFVPLSKSYDLKQCNPQYQFDTFISCLIMRKNESRGIKSFRSMNSLTMAAVRSKFEDYIYQMYMI